MTSVPTKPPPAPDARRAGGERTRRRLIEAAQELIAERGESAIRLRELTDVAGTNLAAVHYHFGGLGALLTAAATEAVERIIDAQIAELDLLPADATLYQITGAYFRPMVQALKGPSSKGRSYVRVLARVASDPPDGLEAWAASVTARAHQVLIARLRGVLPDVPAPSPAADQLLVCGRACLKAVSSECQSSEKARSADTGSPGSGMSASANLARMETIWASTLRVSDARA
jgi:AcrR family transcriptional regulator